MNHAQNEKNALRSEAGDGERPGRTPVGGVDARMVNPGVDQPGPIKSTGNQENIRYIIRNEQKLFKKTILLFANILILILSFFLSKTLKYNNINLVSYDNSSSAV